MERGTALGRGLSSRWLEECVAANRGPIDRDAVASLLRPGELERQVRLHLPSAPSWLVARGSYREAYEAVRTIAVDRAVAIQAEHESAAVAAKVKLLNDADFVCRRSLLCEAPGRLPLRLRFGDVDPEVGRRYQMRLHYLRAVRDDTAFHFGLFLEDAEWPLAYIAVSACDRQYMVRGLPVDGYGIGDIVVLTRMHGLPGLPANGMSLLTKHVVRALRKRSGARVMLTAYNPSLGFCGAVFRASGFSEFAIAPVAYGYDARGEYVTRRMARSVRFSELETPPNVLMARGLDNVSMTAFGTPKFLGRIPDRDYWAAVPPASGTPADFRA
jgi:hypothetical protein